MPFRGQQKHQQQLLQQRRGVSSAAPPCPLSHPPLSRCHAPQAKLPAVKPGGQPLPEGLLWLLLTGDLPTKAQTDSVSHELRRRGKLPNHVKRVLEELPHDTHPMTQLATGILALQVGGGGLHARACVVAAAVARGRVTQWRVRSGCPWIHSPNP